MTDRAPVPKRTTRPRERWCVVFEVDADPRPGDAPIPVRVRKWLKFGRRAFGFLSTCPRDVPPGVTLCVFRDGPEADEAASPAGTGVHAAGATPGLVADVLRAIPREHLSDPAAANLVLDAAQLGDPAWAMCVVELVAAWFARPKPGAATCGRCGLPTGCAFAWTCRACIDAEERP